MNKQFIITNFAAFALMLFLPTGCRQADGKQDAVQSWLESPPKWRGRRAARRAPAYTAKHAERAKELEQLLHLHR